MDQLTPLLKATLKCLCKFTLTKTVHGVTKTYPELTSWSKEEIDAEIEELFGDSLAKVQLALEAKITEGFKQNRKDLQREFYTAHLKETYEHMKNCLLVAREKYNDFISNKEPITLAVFERAEEALDAQMIILHGWITKDSPLYRIQLMKGLARSCDLAEYMEWQQDIRLTMADAYILRIAMHYYTFLARQGQIDQIPQVTSQSVPAPCRNSNNDSSLVIKPWTPLADLPNSVRANMAKIQRRIAETDLAMKEGRECLQTKFLTDSCGASHEHKSNPCGADKNGQCFTLGAIVYQHLGQADRSKTELAEMIAKDLRTTYSYFEWSVAVFGQDHRNVEFQLHPSADIRCIRFGSRPDDSRPENLTTTRGSGSFGCLLCYRSTVNKLGRESHRTALVFWGSAERIWSPTVVRAYRDLGVWVKSGALAALSNSYGGRPMLGAGHGSGKIQFVTSEMSRCGKEYVLGVGIHSLKEPSKAGYDVAQLRDNEEDIEFPFIRTSGDAVWMVIPATVDCELDSHFVLDEGSLKEISFSGYPKVIVSKGRLEDDANHDQRAVVVKEISVAVIKDREQEALPIYDKLCNGLRSLLKLRNRHIVRHLGLRDHSSTGSPSSGLAVRLIMEFCTGGSLTERLEKVGPIPILQIQQWGSSIVNGLDYLQSHGIAHKCLYGDHVMFQAQPDGSEVVKLISIARIPELVLASGGTYNPGGLRSPKLPVSYGPPLQEEPLGSRSDTWQLGCLLIQMVSGKFPVLASQVVTIGAKEYTVKMPQIPAETPKQLAGYILRCLQPDYVKRPYAKELTELSEFELNTA